MSPFSYMSSAVPRTEDFLHENFLAFCFAFDHPLVLRRKLWEFAFIAEHLRRTGATTPGHRGLGFGVGREKLPAYFAALGCEVLATDGPPEVVSPDWAATGQHSQSAVHYPGVVKKEVFDTLVSFETCDMNHIGAHLRDFDFCWSSCSLEHLGSLQLGLDFIENSLETLRPGGVAVHTTELNLTSDDDTVSEGATVLYRRKDFSAFCERLRSLGHDVEELPIALGATAVDHYVDMPPFRCDPHLKLRLWHYDVTSYGLIVRRAGRGPDRGSAEEPAILI